MKTVDALTTGYADVELLQKCKEAIEDVVSDAEVVLYGSRARGDANEYSDYDILVLTDKPVNMALKEKLIESLLPMELDSGKVLTIITYNRQQWDTPLYRAMPLHKNIDREGIVL